MALFEYRAKDIEGRTIHGMVEAPVKAVAVEILTDRNLTPLEINERRISWLQLIASSPLAHIKVKDRVVFSRQLAVMAAATMPITQSLRILEQQTANPRLRVIVSDVADEVEGGAKLSAALAKYPEVFSQFYTSIISSGETSGKLDDVLNYLAEEEEKNYDLLTRIRGAMIYPAFIVFGLLLVGAIMMVYVVPKLTAILQEAGTELPLSTRVLIGISGFLSQWWWVLLSAAVVLAVVGRFYVRTPEGKRLWHRLQLHLPIVGRIYRHLHITRFTRSMYTLVVGGVPLTRSLAIVSDVVGNSVFSDIISRTITEVEGGNSIATVLLQSDQIPAMVPQMMIVGEKTGRLEEIFKRLADFYTHELNNLVTNLVTLLEPLIMLIMGVGVGFVVSSILLPMYRLSGAF